MSNNSIQKDGVFDNKEDQTDSVDLNHCFKQVLERYTPLNNVDVRFRYKKLKSTTMRARPCFVYSFPFTLKTRYEVEVSKYVRGNNYETLSSLPEDVIKGWFAHELGHVEDYQGKTWIEMIWYGIKYLWSDNEARKVEHIADINALNAGFYAELLATKKYLFDERIIEFEYSKRLRKLYMSIQDLEENNSKLITK